MIEARDEFLSEEDLDLAGLPYDELEAWWNAWLEQAQISNEEDTNEYSHGVFVGFHIATPGPARPDQFSNR